MKHLLPFFLCLGLLVGRTPAQEPTLDLEDKPVPGSKAEKLDEMLETISAGTRFRLVPLDQPDQTLTNRLYWRSFADYHGAQTAPVRIQLDGKDIIAPKTTQDPVTLELGKDYPTEGKAQVAPGRHVLQPGNIPLALENNQFSSSHPAIKTGPDDTVRILCAPVRLDAVNADGAPVPVAVRLSCGGLALLREEAKFNPLIVWLPVGLDYQSTLGSFAVTVDGKIKADPASLASGVVATEHGLRLTTSQKSSSPSPAAAPATTLQLTAHRSRTVFAATELATYAIVVPPALGSATAQVWCEREGHTFDLGPISLAGDARLFTVRIADLPPGDYQLWVAAGTARSPRVPLTVVDWPTKSPFVLQTMSCCTDAPPQDDAGLQLLHDCGLEMAAFVGFKSLLDEKLPTPEQRSPNDLILERYLRHGLRAIDEVVVRADSFYMEGLSYHHSYQPSVDRMVRRLQVFSQQTADYPSWWGVNYSWFPALFGYAEGGVPTDAHVVDRNAALEQQLQQAGLTNVTAADRTWYQANKFADDPAQRARALEIMQQAVRYWKAQMDFGFGKHNQLYNDAVREVRPDLACTLFENAGHDITKRTRSLFHDMNAACYESYTDYGEWPMSASFTTDWARGNAPGQPVWITMDWGTTSEGDMKSLFHAFGRGLAGGGVPMQAEAGLIELAHRGLGLRFISQYGAIATRAVPDNRFAILSTAAEQVWAKDGRAQYAYHALYYHLTRLGCPPVVIDDEDAAREGIPDHVKVLFVARQQQPLEPKVREAIAAFQAKGGRVIATGDTLVKIDGAILVDQQIKTIWDLSGFAGTVHGEMWDEFEKHWRAPLSVALAQTGVRSRATTDPDEGVVVSLDAGPMRYVVVIADRKGTKFGEFQPAEALPVSLDGAGWVVRDLVKQKTLPTTTNDGRTEVAVDLITEPTTILALYKTPPTTIDTKSHGPAVLGTDLAVTCNVNQLGPVPVAYTLTDAAGKPRFVLYRAAGDEVTFPLPARDTPGKWTLTVQELITGRTATIPLDVTAPASAPSVAAIGDVHVVNAAQLRDFAARAGEKCVIVEPGQASVLPVAKQLVDTLVAAGVKARLWQVRPEDYDTIPVRWYPRPEDTARLTEINAGRLIGYRKDLTPFIDHKNRVHVPRKGGYAEIEPKYMVGVDAIVFSGGGLAESLRAVTPWMPTAEVPGHGQGRLVTCFSPFMAGRAVVAVIGNDVAGLAKAANRLAELLTAKPVPAAPSPTLADWKPLSAPAAESKPVAQPYVNYVPIRRLQRLLATRDGKAVVYLNGKQDTLAFVDAAGRVTATIRPGDGAVEAARLDEHGRLWHYCTQSPAAPPAGTSAAAPITTIHGIDPDGTRAQDLDAYAGPTHDLAAGSHFPQSFPVAPDGLTVALGRPGGLWLGKLGSATLTWYDDLPHTYFPYEIWTPRFPVGVTFSPDSRCVFFTMDSRPIGFGAMNGTAWTPTGAEAVLADAATGKPLWSLRDPDGRKATYAAHSGFVAVANDGKLTALADFNGVIYLIDRTGRIVFHEQAGNPTPKPNPERRGPADGVGTWIDDAGSVAAFGFTQKLVIVQGNKSVTVALPRMIAGGVSPDGSLVLAALADGQVSAFAPDGHQFWTMNVGGQSPQVACLTGNKTLVATSLGDLIAVDAAGKELWRTNVAAAADRAAHELKPSPGFQRLGSPAEYHPPGTLAYAQASLQAKPIAQVDLAGDAHELFGRKFHSFQGTTELAGAPETKECFLHLVYRRPETNKSLTVTTTGAGATEQFVLDLPTPEYRVVDLPVTGPGAKVTVKAEGAVEIAECSLWSFQWPGGDLAYVRPADSPGGDLTDMTKADTKGNADAILMELGDTDAIVGKMKECHLWSPNMDVDKVSGPWINAPVNPYAMVDGKRFGNGRLPAWATGKFQGAWLTINFGRPVPLKLAATYDRANKQSEVAATIAVFSATDPTDVASGRTLGGAVDNDQFWRLYPFAETKLKMLGVHVRSPGKPEGLSEVQAYW